MSLRKFVSVELDSGRMMGGFVLQPGASSARSPGRGSPRAATRSRLRIQPTLDTEAQ